MDWEEDHLYVEQDIDMILIDQQQKSFIISTA